MDTQLDKLAFIRGHTSLLQVPLTPEISLHLADDTTPLWRLSEEELADLGLPSPFWAFAWAGGQALARYCLDNAQDFKSKTILDFATGSGLVAIAAMIAEAAHVVACDIDPFALEATRLNARHNLTDTERLEVTDTDFLLPEAAAKLIANPPDFLLAGDVFYDAEMTKRTVSLLSALHEGGTRIFIGDPSRAYLPEQHLTQKASYHIPRTRALEDQEIRSTAVWQFAP